MTDAAPAIDPYFERQYNARASIPEHPEIFARWAEDSARVRASHPCTLDLRYGRGEKQTLDIFPAQGMSRALFMFIHGGYWRSLDKSDFSFLAPALTQHGATVALVNYGLCPAVAIDAIVGEMREALLWLLAHGAEHGANPARLYVGGHSAGGHLTAMLLATDWNALYPGLPPKIIKGALAVSGLYDLVPLLETSINQDVRLDATAARALSPAFLRPKTSAPLTLAVGGGESSEFRLQTELLATEWKDHVEVKEVPMPGFHHLNVIEELGREGSPLHAAALHLMKLDRPEEKKADDEED